MAIKSFGNALASFRYRFGGTGNRASNPYVEPPPLVSATGGAEATPGDGYKYHFFTSTGPNPFNVSAGGDIEYLLIAGGGSGADRGNGAGGGGAGGVLGHGMDLPLSAHQGGPVTVTIQDYTLVVGAGATGGAAETTGLQGTPSTGFGKTAVGGGGGGQNNASPSAGGAGGSGGGGDDTSPAGAAQDYPGPSQQGFPGGEIGGGTGGGGGGGAGSAGRAGNASPNPGGGGDGIGFSWAPPSYGTAGPDGSKRYFAGGGGGGQTAANGGYGGGGSSQGYSGTTNTGGGGGSGHDGSNGGAGGPGIIVVRYLV